MNKELLRAAILRILEANDTKFGLGAEVVAQLLPGQGFRIANSEVEAELEALLDLRFVRITNRPLDPKRRVFAITAEGRHQL